MSLQFNLFDREDRELAIPIVFQNHIIHHFLSVQYDCHTVTDHLDVKAVPFTQLIIGHFRRLALVHLVVV
ncbi:unknown [Parabacteroides merdae CAG:48]|nr:unknown [Parabacteroides merdae CAG:48]